MCKYFFSYLLKAVMLAGLTMPAYASDRVTIRVGHVLSPSHSWHTATDSFASEVKEATDGRVQITLFHSSQLGDEKEMIEAIQFGAIGGGVIGSGSFQSVEPVLGITNLPYAWGTREEAYADLDGEMGNRLAEKLDQHGFVTLAWYEGGFRHMTNNKRPILTPEDLHGLKVRVTADKIRLDTFIALGAEPAPLAFGELYSALQQGLFDGQENPVEIIQSNSFYEVQKYLSLTRHVWSSAVLVISNNIWAKISLEDQAAIREIAGKWQTKQRGMVAEHEASITDQLKAQGLIINDIENLEPFKQAVQPVWQEFERQFGSEVTDLIGKG